ncbi:hypothetical protein [Ideonella sp. A 288]|uniref:hypothetical protein n=1 Tax=Ideonella sp. A 288 TaxID=1962181 RepID=UPI000B4B1BFA|nr:hypothetical protein [Ideonella sp. A 288]
MIDRRGAGATLALATALAMALAGCSPAGRLPSVPPWAPGAGEVMTRAELLACLEREAAIDARRVALDRRADRHKAASEAITVEAAAIAEAQQAMKRPGKPALEAMARRVADHNLQVDAHNDETEALNRASLQLTHDVGGYNADCATRRFDPRDHEAARDEHRARGGRPQPP